MLARTPSAILLAILGCNGGAEPTELPALPAPAVSGGTHDPVAGGVLRFSVVEDVRSLDPATAYDAVSLTAEHFLFDTLLAYAPAAAPSPLALVPQLAERWAVSADGLVYSFTIRDGATFSNGEPVLAEDFVYAIDRLLDPRTGSPAQQFYQGIEGAPERLDGRADHTRGLRALDERRLEIRLSAPDASFPHLLAMKFTTPQKRAHVERTGERIHREVLGTGPFVLASWRDGELLVFARNQRYWDRPRPHLDGIELALQVPRDVAVRKFLLAELDVVDRLSSAAYVRFLESPGWRPFIDTAVGMNVFGERMDVTKPPFSDKRVRQALNLAVDKKDAVKLQNGRAVAAHGMLPPGIPGYDPSLAPYPHDPERARRLLAEAGYPDGFEITYVTTPDEIAEKIAQSLQADLAEIGVRMEIQLVTFPVYAELLGSNQLPFSYTGWSMDFPDPWNFLEVKFHSKMRADRNANNDTGYSNPQFDRLLDEARVEPDPTRRLELYRRAERMLIEDCPWVWHYHSVTAEVRQPYVKGYAIHPVWQRDYREVWLDPVRRIER